ncbi:hypothetical protein HAX54_039466, partial [Datura stramonium]|nr:hypothetical protein [Datura stramonium]
MGHVSIALNQLQKGALPSDIVPNLRSDAHYMAITTRNWKITVEEPKLVVNDNRNKVVVDAQVTKKENEEIPKIYIPMLRPPPTFPQCLKKRVEYIAGKKNTPNSGVLMDESEKENKLVKIEKPTIITDT